MDRPWRLALDEGGASRQPAIRALFDALQPLREAVAVGTAGGAHTALQSEQRPPDRPATMGDAVLLLTRLPETPES